MYGRIKLRFMIEDLNFLTDYYDQKYNMYSMFLKVIKSYDKSLAEKIHSGEFPRAFLFSNIIFPIKNKNRRQKERLNFHVYFTSHDAKVTDSLLNGFSKLGNIVSLGKYKLILVESVVETFEDVPSEFTFLSPIVLRDKSGKAPNEYNEELFIEMIKNGIYRVAEKLKKDKKIEGLGDFDISFSLNGNGCELKKKLYNVKGTYIRAWSATSPDDLIVFSGDPVAKAIALYYGVGDRTTMGFGMLGIPKKNG